jgi:hypothetical protein
VPERSACDLNRKEPGLIKDVPESWDLKYSKYTEGKFF